MPFKKVFSRPESESALLQSEIDLFKAIHGEPNKIDIDREQLSACMSHNIILKEPTITVTLYY